MDEKDGSGKGQEARVRDFARFNIPANDAKGHSVRKSFRITPAMEHQIDLIMSNPNRPWKTEGEFLRHAVLRQCELAIDMDPTVPSMMNMIKAMIEILGHEQACRDFESIIDRTTTEVNSLSGKGAVERARELVTRIMAEVDRIPDEFWRKQYRDELMRRFAYLVDPSRFAELRETNNEG